ncbi:hypothetical protein [Taklimakanibacter deserti]|uniref:hypothetical protein n=1 Tax=Taklimakanibacter deserti TaxID=2267839 RepID=UPI0013C452B4
MSKEMAVSEAMDLRRQVEKSLKRDPLATSIQVTLGGELYEIDGGSAQSFLARLAPDRPRMSNMSIPPILAIGVIVALLAGWGAIYLKFSSSLDAANVEMVKLASQIVQRPRTNPGLLTWAVDRLAKDAEIEISPERRQEMIQVLTTYPDTSFETIAEIYGSGLPELNGLVGRLETYDFWHGKKSAGGGSVNETQKSDTQQPSASRKEIIDRLPEEQSEESSGQSQTVYPKTPGR